MFRLLFRMLTGSRLPTVQGEIAVSGLERSAVIRRDGYGVPYIEAESDGDAAFALGFAQAQDRAGQLEFIQRLTRGTLAELAGAAALPADRLMRRLGFHRAALEQLEVLDVDVLAFVSAFCAGINAGFEHGSKHNAHEFHFLKTAPTPWIPADVLAFVKFMSFQLPSNWDVELARFLMLREDGPAAVAALDPVGIKAADRHNINVDRLLDELKYLNEFAPRGGGSNNWVVDGSRSATGKPLLAGDPHLGPSLPNPWYLAQVRTPDWSVAGAMFAGSPVFPIAHNETACWSVTAGLTDTTDLFIESLSDDGKQCRQADGTWIECKIVRETIRVKNGNDVVEDVVITPRGPIVTPLIPGETLAISLQAVWLKPRKLRGFFEAAKRNTFEEFRLTFSAWPVLPLNVLYADRAGTIGYQLAGDLPVRGFGQGLLPTPVKHGDWKGFVEFDRMPHGSNPKQGLIATANDDPARHYDTQAFLGADYCDSYRADAIRAELAKRNDWNAKDFQQLQLNVRSKPWEQIREMVLAIATDYDDANVALAELKNWNGLVEADSPAAAIFELFIAEMATRAAKAKAPNCWKLALGGDGHGPFASSLLADRRVQHLVSLIVNQPDGWFERGWQDEMADALRAAVARLKQQAGPSVPYWAWGHRRVLMLRHPLFGKHWLLKRAFNIGPFPIGGDMNTIQQAGVRPLDPFGETHNFPNLRTTFDTSDWNNCRFALAGGQSGNPCSPHFDDQFPLWQRGEGIPIHWTKDDIVKNAVASLQLKQA